MEKVEKKILRFLQSPLQAEVLADVHHCSTKCLCKSYASLLKNDDNPTSTAPRTFINQLPDWIMLLAAITTIFLAAEKQWMMLDWKTKRPDMLSDLDPFGLGRMVEDGFIPTRIGEGTRDKSIIPLTAEAAKSVKSNNKGLGLGVDQEREGEQIDRASLKNVLYIFMEIGMGQMDYYENDFEASMHHDTAAYYSRKASN
ncbi:unnamed protein product [Lactuca saligna]|uniref:Uncharacterized protein n=1 Tax=Lactuca saligna TaxID=75948 RepID=A0AA35ZVP5_LACSI|nr:unnamed protein product [Lactuca saligna]